MSNRGNGLVAAIDEIFPNAVHGYCCQHLAENIEANGFWKKCKRLFWCAAFAKSEAAFDAVFVKIRAEDPNCYDHLKDVPAERWATYAFPRPRYGHLTSNIQESVNSSWLKARYQPVLHCLLHIWEYVMNLMYSRQKKQHHTKRLTDAAWNYIKKVQEKGRRDTVSSSTQHLALIRPFERFTVSAPQGTSHIVDLTNKTCTYMHFQDRKLPCCHTCQVCQEHNLDLESYVSPVYTIETYRSLYSDWHAMPPICLQNLPSDAHCLAPKIQKRKGRPRKKRLWCKVLKRGKRPKHCQICRSTEHDRCRCDYSGPPINVVLQQNRRRQQTGDAELDINQSPPDPSPPSQHLAALIWTNPVIPRDNDRHFSSTSSLTSLEDNQNDESDSDRKPPQTPTPESTYSEGEERFSVRCARLVLTEDPSYTEALEGYRLFPEQPEFKLMVE